MRVKFCAAALTLLLMGACLSGPTSAAPFAVMPAWLGTPHDMVFNIAQRGEQTWAVGSFGILVKRTPQSPWKLVSDTGGMAMLGIAFAPSGDGVAVGQAGSLYEVATGYDTWTRHDVGTTERLFAVAASPKGEFVATGSFGTILDRPAGSKQWRQVNTTWSSGTTPHLYGVVFADDTTAYVVGEDETLVTVKNGIATEIRDLGQREQSQSARGRHSDAGGGRGRRNQRRGPGRARILHDGQVWRRDLRVGAAGLARGQTGKRRLANPDDSRQARLLRYDLHAGRSTGRNQRRLPDGW